MIADMNNIVSLTDFKRNAADIVRRVRSEKSPAILTVNGSPSVVVLDANEYQQMSRDAQMGSIMRGIESGLDSMEAGRSIALGDAFDMLARDIKMSVKKHG